MDLMFCCPHTFDHTEYGLLSDSKLMRLGNSKAMELQNGLIELCNVSLEKALQIVYQNNTIRQFYIQKLQRNHLSPPVFV